VRSVVDPISGYQTPSARPRDRISNIWQLASGSRAAHSLESLSALSSAALHSRGLRTAAADFFQMPRFVRVVKECVRITAPLRRDLSD
jgi:hypothetical protein